jgi:hypothetical protein
MRRYFLTVLLPALISGMIGGYLTDSNIVAIFTPMIVINRREIWGWLKTLPWDAIGEFAFEVIKWAVIWNILDDM